MEENIENPKSMTEDIMSMTEDIMSMTEDIMSMTKSDRNIMQKIISNMYMIIDNSDASEQKKTEEKYKIGSVEKLYIKSKQVIIDSIIGYVLFIDSMEEFNKSFREMIEIELISKKEFFVLMEGAKMFRDGKFIISNLLDLVRFMVYDVCEEDIVKAIKRQIRLRRFDNDEGLSRIIEEGIMNDLVLMDERNLKLSNYYLSNMCGIKYFGQLLSLDLSGLMVYIDEQIYVMEPLQSLVRLVYLNLEKIKYYTKDENGEWIVADIPINTQFFEKLLSLIILDLSYDNIICSVHLWGLSELRILILNNANIANTEFLGGLISVKELHIENTKMKCVKFPKYFWAIEKLYMTFDDDMWSFIIKSNIGHISLKNCDHMYTGNRKHISNVLRNKGKLDIEFNESKYAKL